MKVVSLQGKYFDSIILVRYQSNLNVLEQGTFSFYVSKGKIYFP